MCLLFPNVKCAFMFFSITQCITKCKYCIKSVISILLKWNSYLCVKIHWKNHFFTTVSAHSTCLKFVYFCLSIITSMFIWSIIILKIISKSLTQTFLSLSLSVPSIQKYMLPQENYHFNYYFLFYWNVFILHDLF